MCNGHTGYCYISGWTENKLAWGFRLYIDVCTVTCNIWQAPLLLFFWSHGVTRVRTFFIDLQSNIFDSTTIKLKWHTVKHLFKFYMELDGISSTSFQVFDYADLKGKRQRNLKPFYFAWLNLRLPPRLHVTRARPYQGGSWECWGPPWISTFETWNIYWEYIYVIFLHTDIHTNSLVLIRPAQPTQKIDKGATVLRIQRINGRQYRLNKSRPIGRNAFI